MAYTGLESVFRKEGHNWAKSWFRYSAGFEEDDSPETRDPQVSEPDGAQISRVPFKQITARFPNTELGTEAIIMQELKALRGQMDELTRRLADVQEGGGRLLPQSEQSAASKKKRKGSGRSRSSSSDH
jgi:hypothetical protein